MSALFVERDRFDEAEAARRVIESNMRARGLTAQRLFYVAERAEIQVELLPAYAPELNPEEYCHGNIKQHLRNARPSNKQEIRAMLDRDFASL